MVVLVEDFKLDCGTRHASVVSEQPTPTDPIRETSCLRAGQSLAETWPGDRTSWQSVPDLWPAARRSAQQLLAEAGYRFACRGARADGRVRGVQPRDARRNGGSAGPAERRPTWLEQLRDDPAAKRPARRMIVACDTVCECLGQILGKPADREHARRMLRLLSGREHRVYQRAVRVAARRRGSRGCASPRTTLADGSA